MITSRIPFAYTLIDSRHRPFAEGRRNILLTVTHIFLSIGFFRAFIIGCVGLFFLLPWGISGLAHDFSVRNDWVITDAFITAVVTVQNGNHFNWHYFYTFQMKGGKEAAGKVVMDKSNAFQMGQSIPIRYLRSNPSENHYILQQGITKSTGYWVLAGLGTLWVCVTAKPVCSYFAGYRRNRALSCRGRAVPGEIVGVYYPLQPSGNIELEYTFTSPTGNRQTGCYSVPAAYFTGDPMPGTSIAVWWAQDETAQLEMAVLI